MHEEDQRDGTRMFSSPRRPAALRVVHSASAVPPTHQYSSFIPLGTRVRELPEELGGCRTEKTLEQPAPHLAQWRWQCGRGDESVSAIPVQTAE